MTQMACSHLLRGQAFNVSGRLSKRIGKCLTKTEERLAKLAETVILLLNGSVITLTGAEMVTLTSKCSVILNCGPPNLLSAYLLLCFHLYSVCA